MNRNIFDGEVLKYYNEVIRSYNTNLSYKIEILNIDSKLDALLKEDPELVKLINKDPKILRLIKDDPSLIDDIKKWNKIDWAALAKKVNDEVKKYDEPRVADPKILYAHLWR